MKPLTTVVAFDLNRCIGKEGKVPWDLAEDRKHFVRVTKGHSIIMGRATWDSIGRPLPNRRSIVISRNRDLKLDGAEVAHSLLEAIELARQTDEDPRIIGGGLVYGESLGLVTRVIATVVLTNVQGGDTFFPILSLDEWKCVESTQTEKAVYRTYERIVP